jgi:hypothetical protein
VWKRYYTHLSTVMRSACLPGRCGLVELEHSPRAHGGVELIRRDFGRGEVQCDQPVAALTRRGPSARAAAETITTVSACERRPPKLDLLPGTELKRSNPSVTTLQVDVWLPPSQLCGTQRESSGGWRGKGAAHVSVSVVAAGMPFLPLRELLPPSSAAVREARASSSATRPMDAKYVAASASPHTHYRA